jgi:hypothetical protein
MIEYKYIQLDDTADPEAASLKRLVDNLEPMPRKYIWQLKKANNALTVYWNTWKPTAADRQNFQRRVCLTAEVETYENVVNPTFRLSPSLHSALEKLDQSERAGNAPAASPDDLDQLQMWGLAKVEYDYDYITQTFTSPSQSTIYLRKYPIKASVTAKGKKYLAQGFLENLR